MGEAVRRWFFDTPLCGYVYSVNSLLPGGRNGTALSAFCDPC